MDRNGKALQADHLFDQLPMAVVRTDCHWRILAANAAACTLFGQPSDALVGKNATVLCGNENDFQRWKEATELGCRRGPVTSSIRCAKADQQSFFAQIISRAAHADHAPDSCVHVVSDITQQRMAEARLTAFVINLKGLHRLQTKGHDDLDQLVWDYLAIGREIFDMETAIFSRIDGDTFVIRGIETDGFPLAAGDSLPLGEMFCSEVVSQRHTFAVYHASQNSQLRDHPGRFRLGIEAYVGTPVYLPLSATRSGPSDIFGTLSFVSRTPRSDALEDYALDILELMADNVGRFIGLQQAELRMQSLVNAAPDAILTIDERGTIHSANPAVERVFGYSANMLTGKNVRMLMPEPHRSQHDGYLREYRDTGQPRILGTTRRLEGQRRDGSLFPIELSVSGTRIGGRQWFIGIVRDVSEREEIDRLKSEFVSVVSHELRTPLTSIRGSLGLLKGGVVGPLSDKAAQLAAIALSNTDRLVRLINDILDLDKIEAGKAELVIESLDIEDVVQAAIRALAGAAREAEVEVRYHACPDGDLAADRDRLIQVLTNLLGNALKFSPPGSSVSISCGVDESQIRFGVQDQGPGIDPAEQHQLFSKFHQLDSSDSRRKGGTGLGLAISKAIVEQHGGSIGLTSAPGQGSTFYFMVPRRPKG